MPKPESTSDWQAIKDLQVKLINRLDSDFELAAWLLCTPYYMCCAGQPRRLSADYFPILC